VNWRAFSVSLAQAVAWPATVLAVVLVFRKELASLLGHRLKRFRAGPVEAEWDRQLESARDAVESEAPAPVAVGATDEPASGRPEESGSAHQEEPTNAHSGPGDSDATSGSAANSVDEAAAEDLLNSPDFMLEEARSVLGLSPRSAVSVAFGALDLALTAFAHRFHVDADNERTKGRLSVVAALAERALIGPGLVDAVVTLRRLRNVAAHSGGDISQGEAREYLATVTSLVGTIQQDAFLYEARVANVLSELGYEVQRGKVSDLIATTDGRSVGIYVKYVRQGMLAPYSVASAFGEGPRLSHNVLVTNSLLSSGVPRLVESMQSLAESFAVVTWTGPLENLDLMEAIATGMP
jgi:hypothetical protein